MNTFEENLEFSFFRFLFYGWYGWIVNPLLGILLSPLLFMKYSIQGSSFKKGKYYTKRKIYFMFKTGLGYKYIDPYSKYFPAKKGRGILGFLVQVCLLISIVGIPFLLIYYIWDTLFNGEGGDGDSDD